MLGPLGFALLGIVLCQACQGSDNSLPGSNTDLTLPPQLADSRPKTSNAMPRRVHHFRTGGKVKTIAYSTDGKLIAIANDSPTFIMQRNGADRVRGDWKPLVEILDAKTGKTIVSLKLTTDDEDILLAATERVPNFEVSVLVFSPDGNVVAVGTSVGQVKLFNARTGELVWSLNDEQAMLADKETPQKLKSLTRAMGSVASLAFSPDGGLLAMCGDSFGDNSRDRVGRHGVTVTGPGRLKVWDVRTGTLKHDLVGHNRLPNAVAFSPDGNLLASAGGWLTRDENGTGVILWNPKTWAKVRTVTKEANGGTNFVAFSPNSKLLVIGSRTFDKDSDTSTTAVSVARVGTGIVEWQRTVPGWANPKAFSPDGKSVAVLCGGQSIRFFDAETGEMKHEIRSIDSHQGGRWNDFAITPQGHMLAVGGIDAEKRGFVTVWDLESASVPE